MKSKQQQQQIHYDVDESASSTNNNSSTPKKKQLKTPKHRLSDGKTTLSPQEYDTLNFFYKPHTLLCLAVAGIVTIYFAFNNEQSSEGNVKTGLLGVCAAFLLFSMLQMRDGLFVRPHPAFWRVVMGMGVIYLCGLVFLLFQTADDARLIMKHIDPKLGVKLPERSYAENCDLYTPDHPESNFKNLKDTVNDEFIWAHLFGWWGKTLLLRDPILCWTLSITFEILELTFAHWLPNFHECWWDHISVIELNAFFLKTLLWIPPPNPINIYRLLLLCLIGTPGLREYYQYITDKQTKKLGTMAWICIAIISVEVLICVKYGGAMFWAIPMPPQVKYPWIIGLTIFTVGSVFYFGFYKKSKKQSSSSATNKSIEKTE
ncbi:phosphatidylserine synthase [Heterostelium album PN500]|uniref:Phosphatidylserine synthase n=1 Tax=Heterostelium pallidum (strain ATCC 26659 / Pp 5 / PN500) TaxID=670386 RepID=D3BIM8_HETP5|nr:phosphatidylserine synthase [Heterostelium album PN500]EFA78652.1 phosphatidylserine synthase [Heterostelium album PN500]|eukprot:XP_020430776.1 phosphatidylserine synthase [Heterostelium album PN500]